PAFRERMLDRLVLPDRAPEDDPLARVHRRTPERRAADADRLRRDQDALGIHAVQDRAEAVTLGADAVLLGHLEAVDEDHVRVDGVATHLVDRTHLDT